ncbi:hypothetical protein JKP88DRAFT_179331, partial [Tribonema minus]
MGAEVGRKCKPRGANLRKGKEARHGIAADGRRSANSCSSGSESTKGGGGGAPLSVDQQVEWLLSHLQPCETADRRRQAVMDQVSGIVSSYLGRQLFACGSFPLRTYLADGDLDLVLFCGPCPSSADHGHPDHELLKVSSALCLDVLRQNDGAGYSSVRNVNFVNARTRIVTCIVGSLSVDITVNQIGSLAAALLLEEADRRVRDHLIKRSVLLLKAWGLHEAPRYAGITQPVFGAKATGLTSYALSIMVLRLFALNACELRTPTEVLLAFFREYSDFDWDNLCVTLSGSKPLSASGGSGVAGGGSDQHKFAALVSHLRSKIAQAKEGAVAAAAGAPPERFQHRFCNIQDPLNDTNNLGHSVSLPVLRSLISALAKGRQHLEALL